MPLESRQALEMAAAFAFGGAWLPPFGVRLATGAHRVLSSYATPMHFLCPLGSLGLDEGQSGGSATRRLQERIGPG